MVASIKSCYSSSLGIPLFNDSPLKGDDYDKFLKNSEDFLTLHTCVTNAANSDLLQEYSEFARELRDNKRAENNQKVSANKNLGAGSYPPDMMLTILILKEYRNVDFDEIAMSCLYDLRIRIALGIEALDLPVPTRQIIINHSNYAKAFNQYKTDQLGKPYSIFNVLLRNLGASAINYFGKDNYTGTVRFDSTPTGSNIAHKTRVEIVIDALEYFLKGLSVEQLSLLSITKDEHWITVQNIIGIGGKRISYDTSDNGKAVLNVLGYVMQSIVTDVRNHVIGETDRYPLLERVFVDQYDNEGKSIAPRRGQDISPDSLQNINDPDAAYSNKYKPIQGEVTNVSEIVAKHETVTDENGNETKIQKAPHVLTGIEVDRATVGDTKFVDASIDSAKEVGNACGHEITTALGDGGYDCPDEKREELKKNGTTLATTELKGKESAFTYAMQDDGTVLVTDKNNPENTCIAVPVNTRNGVKKWKFETVDESGKAKQHIITEDSFRRQEIREEQKSLPADIRKTRNNVEATVREIKRGWYNGKVRYRGIISILTGLSAKAVGIQVKRICNFCRRNGRDLSELRKNWK